MFYHIQIPTSTPMMFKPQFSSILSVYMVAGGAPNLYTRKNFGLNLRWLSNSSTNLMYLEKQNDNWNENAFPWSM